LIPIINWLTSFFAGFVIFAYMGYLSFVTGQDIKTIATAGNWIFVFKIYSNTFFINLIFFKLRSRISFCDLSIRRFLHFNKLHFKIKIFYKLWSINFSNNNCRGSVLVDLLFFHGYSPCSWHCRNKTNRLLNHIKK